MPTSATNNPTILKKLQFFIGFVISHHNFNAKMLFSFEKQLLRFPRSMHQIWSQNVISLASLFVSMLKAYLNVMSVNVYFCYLSSTFFVKFSLLETQ